MKHQILQVAKTEAMIAFRGKGGKAIKNKYAYENGKTHEHHVYTFMSNKFKRNSILRLKR